MEYLLRHSNTLVIGVCVNSTKIFNAIMQSGKMPDEWRERAPSHLSIKTREIT